MIAAVVITYNEERNIARCLESLRWADEVIVVDSYSTDRTLDIAAQHGARVLQHAYDSDIKQRERGFAVTTAPWLFYVDADEEVTPELRDEIRSVTASSSAADGYSVPRLVAVFGTWVRNGGWYPDLTFRLFRRDRYRALDAEVHGGFTVDGRQGVLTGHLNHYTYETIGQYIAKMNDYTSLQVSSKLRDDPGVRVGWTKIVLSPLSHFLRKYFSQKGYRDGVVGFLLAALGALYTLALYAKVWEYQYRRREGKGLLPPITNLELKAHRRL